VQQFLPRQEPQLEQRRFAQRIRQYAPAPERILLFWAEPHALAFHLGRPLESLIEWEDLDARLAGGRPVYVVMPPDVAQRSAGLLHNARLEEVLRDTDLGGGNPKRPLVLMRSVPLAVTAPPTESPDARCSRTAADRDRAPQPDPDGAPGRSPPRRGARRLARHARRPRPRLRDPPGQRRQQRPHRPPRGSPGRKECAPARPGTHPAPRGRRGSAHRRGRCPL